MDELLLRRARNGDAEAFEALPLVQDAHLMRNILYSGVWQTYNYKMNEQEKNGKGGAQNGH